MIAGCFSHVGLYQLHTRRLQLCTVLYAVDEDVHGQNILQSVAID